MNDLRERLALKNKAMQRKLESREAIDVIDIMLPAEPGDEVGAIRLRTYIDDKDYCNSRTGEWIWSIGRREADGAIFAAADSRYYLREGYECLWLR